MVPARVEGGSVEMVPPDRIGKCDRGKEAWLECITSLDSGVFCKCSKYVHSLAETAVNARPPE
jgi:hypothetical protein